MQADTGAGKTASIFGKEDTSNIGLTVRIFIAVAACIVLTSSVRAETVGVVMMHGKTGKPAQLAALADAVNAAGFPVERPEMCWSRTRIYDRTYLDCLADADTAAAALKARGVDAIVILGMSLGGNAALGYGARRSGLKGVIALAPASNPDDLRERPPIARSLTEAEALIAAGKGDERRTFTDLNNGRKIEVTATPKIFVSFFGKETPGEFSANAAHLTAPLLIVSGSADPTQRSIDAVYQQAPHDPRSAHDIVQSDHMSTPTAATENVVAWLKSLNR
jgi:esterase/lipase